MLVQTTRSNATDIFRDMTVISVLRPAVLSLAVQNSIDVASDLTTHTKQEFVQIDLVR